MSGFPHTYRSNCPVNFGLEAIGDRWSLLIIRDIVFWGKKTYSDFLRSDEQIATNILASRLASLEELDILTRVPDSADKRKDVYRLTAKGLDLIPLLVEIVSWSGKQGDWQSIGGPATPEQINAVMRFATAKNRTKIAAEIRETVENGGYFFKGVTQPINPRRK
ncbi:MAG TPA: helix-turn-helix domain-containing protein [Pyrinomonadaceae bacterium]